MTIEKGGVWGEPWNGVVPFDDVPVAADDAELAEFLARASDRSGDESPEGRALVRPRRGDLLRTIGLDGPRDDTQSHRYPVDLVIAHLQRGNGETVSAPFVAHLTVRDRRLTGIGPGLSLAVMNAAWLGPLRLGPRAHPNDGLVDITEGTVGLFQRREANRRAVSGSHLPHPELSTSRRSTWGRTWPRPVAIWLDGRRIGRFERVQIEVVPDAGVVVA